MRREFINRVRKIEVFHLFPPETPGNVLATEGTGKPEMPGKEKEQEQVFPQESGGHGVTALPEIPEMVGNRDGYYESQICPGLWFDKYRLDVEMDGQADLTPLQFAILTLLDDKCGTVDIEFVKTKCWTKHPSRESFANKISELNEKLMNIGVREKTIAVNKGTLSFE